MNERLLTGEEVIEIRIKYWTGWNDDNDCMKQILLAQDAKTAKALEACKSIAEHNKWIAEQKQDIAQIIRDKYDPFFSHENEAADAIISLLTEGK